MPSREAFLQRYEDVILKDCVNGNQRRENGNEFEVALGAMQPPLFRVRGGRLRGCRIGHAVVPENGGLTPQQVIDLLAAATADMFNGPNVSMIERMFKESAWAGGRRFPLFPGNHRQQREPDSRLPARQDQPEYVAVFVCRKTANLGMALTKARLAMPALEATF